MKIKNSTTISTATLRHILKFVLPDNVDFPLAVNLTNSSRGYAGRYMHTGHVLIRIGSVKTFPRFIRPYQYAQHTGKKWWVASREEALVYVAAHELRHHWQNKGKMRNSFFPDGYVRNAKGKYSEVDTEAYALHTLRAWRNRELKPQRSSTASARPASA